MHDFYSIVRFGGYGLSDILIYPNSNQNTDSFSYLGDGYECPPNIEPNTNEANSYLAGSEHFSLSEIETYKITFLE